MSGGDADVLKELERYDSPKAVNDARRAAAKQISSVGLRVQPPAADATPEQIAQYRKDMGIPDKPEAYAMPEGLVIGDADKPLVGSYTKYAHENNMTPAEVQKNLKWWQGEQVRLAQETIRLDTDYKNANTAKLAEKWGGDTQRNVKHVEDMLDGLGIKKSIMEARGPDGRPLGANAETIFALANLAFKLNPIVSAGYSGNAAGASAANAELEALVKMRKEGGDNGPYWKGPDAAKHQARYRELLIATGQAAAE